MVSVYFTVSGQVRPRNIYDASIPTSGTAYLIDQTNNTMVGTATITGSDNIPITGSVFHTTRQNYYLVSSFYGANGQAIDRNVSSPTNEYLFEDFQINPNPSGGTGITEVFHNENYETGAAVNTVLTMSGGTGSVTYSGIRNTGELEGSYHVALLSDFYRVLTIEPSSTTTTGMTAGRAIYSAKLGGGTGAGPEAEVAFIFMRQGNTLTSNCYKFVTSVGETTTEFQYTLAAGAMTDGFGSTRMNDLGSAIEYTYQKYTNGATRSGNVWKWFMVEWEMQSSGTLFQVSFKDYVDGDTVDTISGSLLPLFQSFYTGFGNGASYYTTTSLKPCLMLTSRSNNGDNRGYMAIDTFHLDKLTTLPTSGLNSFNYIMRNSGVTANNARPKLVNILVDDGSPSGHINKTGTNYLLTSTESKVSEAGKGMSGIICTTTTDGDNGDFAVAFLELRGTSSSGIKHGVCRYACTADGTGNKFSKLGFSFLRQGTSHNSNAYTVILYPNTASDYRVQIQKGAIYSTLTDDTTGDFSATTLVSGSTLYTTGTKSVWVEVRWKVTGSQTDIQVLTAMVDDSLSTFDTSPGNVDSKLVEAVSYSDSSSAYTTTSLAPCFIMRGTNGTASKLYQAELRRSKLDV